MTNKKTAIFLLFPVIVLLGLTLLHQYRISAGTEVTFRVFGYDPRNLISGHFLIYQIDFKTSDSCNASSRYGSTVNLCLDDGKFSQNWQEDCRLQIKGECRGSRFLTGAERFFIPEEHGDTLDRALRSSTRESPIMMTFRLAPDGKLYPKDFTIEGVNWKKWAVENTQPARER